MKLHPDLNEFLLSLNAAEVRYLVVGGYAVAAHGHVRYTKDLDVWIEASRENAARVTAALRAFGAESLGFEEAELATPGRVFQMGVEPARIDLLTRVSGLEFEYAYRRRTETTLDEVPIAVLCREDLGRNKRATGRLRDLADLEDLGLLPPEPRATHAED